MEKLPKQRTFRGYDYECVIRDDTRAIYSQSDNGKIVAYEVFEIQKQKAGPMTYPNGVTVDLQAKELFAGDSKWGTLAWSCKTMDKAMEYWEHLGRLHNERQSTAVPIS